MASRIKSRKFGKKGANPLTLVDSIVLIIAFIVFSLFFAWLIFGGNIKCKEEIKKTGQNLKDESALLDLLRTPVTIVEFGGGETGGAGAGKGWEKPGSDGKSSSDTGEGGVGTSAEDSLILADLISRMHTTSGDLNKLYEKKLRERATYILDKSYGSSNWKLKVNIIGNFIEIGSVSGDTESSEAVIPTYNGQILNVYLITKKAK